MGLIRTAVYLVLLYMIVSTLLSAWITNKSYSFKVGAVSRVGKANSGFYFNYDNLYEDLAEKFSGKIFINDEFPWMSLSTGHLNGKVKLLYASLTEMLVVYHTMFDTVGQSGRHFMNMSVTVLKGEVSMSHEPSMKPTNFQAGDVYVHRYGESTQLQFKKDSYILIYARGIVPLSMFYWLFDSLFSTFDFATIALVLFYFVKGLHMKEATIRLYHWVVFLFGPSLMKTAMVHSLNLVQSITYAFNMVWTYIHLAYSNYTPWISNWFYDVVCKAL